MVKTDDLKYSTENKQSSEKRLSYEWPRNTVLITGDSILNNIEENRLNKRFSESTPLSWCKRGRYVQLY